MKLVHVFSRFKTHSGAEHLAFRLCEEAVRHGDEVTIVTRHFPERLRKQLPDEVEIRQLGLAHRPTRIHFFESICDVLYSIFLFRLVPADSDCDLYWNDNTLASLFLDSLFRKKLRVFYCLQVPEFAYGRTLLTTRSYPPLSWLVPLFVPLYRWLDKLFARRADSVLTISEMVKNDCLRVYRDLEVTVATLGVDPPTAEMIDRELVRRMFPLRTETVLVTVGKLSPKKRIELFVEVVAVLRKRGVDVSGVIVGDGPLRDRIERQVQDQGLVKHCFMTGFVRDYDDVLRYMSGATIYVYLEQNVPFGLTVVEAGAVGAPVAAVSGGGVEETVRDGVNGRKIPPQAAAEEIADVLAEMLEDPEGLQEMGRRGKEMAAERAWQRVYERIRAILTQRATRFAAPEAPAADG